MANKVLLLMDLQNAILQMANAKDNYYEKINNVISYARKELIPVIFVVVKFRKNYPEINSNNKSFNSIKSMGFSFEDNSELVQISPKIDCNPDDIIITKRRVSAFSGSDLEIILKSQNINHLVLTGIATSGVVLSTIREACDKDYQVTVIEDCCLDMDDEVHRVLTEKIFPKQASVIKAEQFILGK